MSNVCKYCNAYIEWRTDTGKPVPYNADGTRHDCRSRKVDQPVKQPQAPAEYRPNASKVSLAPDILGTKEFDNKVRLLVREEIEKMLKKAMAF